MVQLTLTPQQVTELTQFQQQTRKVKEWRRTQVIILRHQRLTCQSIADTLGFHRKGVEKILRRYQRRGLPGLFNHTPTGGPRKLSPEHIQHLLTVLEQSPHLRGHQVYSWNCSVLAQELRHIFQIAITPERVRQVLRKYGQRFRRPKLRIVSPDPQYEVKKTLLNV